MNREELVYLMAFKKIENVGDRTIDKLYRKFNSFERAWHAEDDKMRELKLQSSTLTSLLESRKKIDIDDIQKEITGILSQGVKVGTKFDGENYPPRLHDLEDAPLVVYVKGDIKDTDGHAVAIVGTREPSQLGRDSARTSAQELAREGYTIISGLAHGIDTQAHLGALDVGGRTIAVLGTGFARKVFYPRENFPLFNQIVENGFCISEFPPDAQGLGHRMYMRNRIISILSKGVLIVEMKNRTHGGTLVQAWYAKNQGKKVFVLESVDKVSGNNEGWKILKRDVEPIVVRGYEDVVTEIEKSITKQPSLLHYGVSTAAD